jgi:predicted ATPase
MNKIGFKYFRQFYDFPEVELGPITFLVGRNNSGKSTVVKALLLVEDYLKTDILGKMSFAPINLEDTNIVTFGRALNKEALEEVIDIILFQYCQGDFSFFIGINGENDDTSANVFDLTIKDESMNIEYYFEQPSKLLFIEKSKKEVENDSSIDTVILKLQFKEELKKLKETRINIKKKSSQEYLNINQEISLLESKIKSLNSLRGNDTLSKLGFRTNHEYSKESISEILFDAINSITEKYQFESARLYKGKKVVGNFADYRAFYKNKNSVETSVKNFLQQIRNTRYVYLGATLSKQSALFAIRDKSNALAQAIHEFKQLNILPGEAAYRFVQNWMGTENFDVGNSFEIKMHAGEAYEFTIDGIHLADKGMGSIQAMLLILRLATIIHKKEKDNKDYTVIIEEPELNLHPKLQSRLADLFYEVFSEFDIKLIIETHSEYLIRKSQLLVKEEELGIKPNENPFCVIYFDSDKQWKMNYREDGVFIENFGTGFFDVSSQHAISLMKRKA